MNTITSWNCFWIQKRWNATDQPLQNWVSNSPFWPRKAWDRYLALNSNGAYTGGEYQLMLRETVYFWQKCGWPWRFLAKILVLYATSVLSTQEMCQVTSVFLVGFYWIHLSMSLWSVGQYVVYQKAWLTFSLLVFIYSYISLCRRIDYFKLLFDTVLSLRTVHICWGEIPPDVATCSKAEWKYVALAFTHKHTYTRSWRTRAFIKRN